MVRATAKQETFDAQKHLTRVSGGDYLEVKWRLVWLRSEHPDAEIMTSLTGHDPGKFAVFECRIKIPGGGSATGWGSETQADFKDYLEKAETKAIGRACAALGYGTQFSGYDFSVPLPNGSPQIVDAPVSTTPSPQAAEDSGGDVETLGSRANLLARCTQEQNRIGPSSVLTWMRENTDDGTGNPKKKKSDMTDDDLQRFLAWANLQPSQA